MFGKMTEDMYRENIMDYYKNPRNKGSLAKPDIKNSGNNPLCGDEISMEAALDKQGKIKEARFDGKGCAICMSSASMLTETIIGKPLDFVKKLKTEDIVEMLGITLVPIRVKCAVLGLKVLQEGIEKYKGDK